MNIIAVDDEQYALRALEEAIKSVAEEAEVACFSFPSDALKYARENTIDVAFLDISMPEMNGIFLAKHLKDIYAKTNIIFVTSYDEYANKAFEVRASGYVMKPIDPQAVLVELNNLRNPVEQLFCGRVRIQCFDNFGIFVDEKPFLISRPKAKELLAYLVHKKGASATSAEIASILWEDKKYNKSLQSQTRNTVSQLMTLLKEAGISNIIHKEWNSIAVDTRNVSCDYYDFLQGSTAAVNAYRGKYLDEYSWAEFTTGHLNERLDKK